MLNYLIYRGLKMTALVLGHKNPDTDSIVAALAAANLYKGRGIDVKAVAQGAPAPETEFVLKKFNSRFVNKFKQEISYKYSTFISQKN